MIRSYRGDAGVREDRRAFTWSSADFPPRRSQVASMTLSEVLITADGGYRRVGGPLKKNADDAMPRPRAWRKVVVRHQAGRAVDRGRDVWWHESSIARARLPNP